MRRFWLITLSIFTFSCSKTTKAEEPITYDDIMNSAWQEYANFRFANARNLFSQILSINSQDLEAYYGYALSCASLSLYDEAFSSASVGIFTQAVPISKAVREIILSNVPDTVVISAQKIGSDSVITGYYYISITDTPILEFPKIFVNNKPRDVYAFTKDKIIAPFIIVKDASSGQIKDNTLPGINDTFQYSLTYPTVGNLDILVWNDVILASGTGYLANQLDQALIYGYLAYYTNPIGNLNPRIIKSFTPEQNIYNLVKILYDKSFYFNLVDIIHSHFDTQWPYQNWGSNIKADISWVVSNTSAIKNKYYEVLANQP
ncbi:MAG: hypothetical protein ABIL49_05495 [candidate division WOR-3 bacterium]